MRYLLDTDVLIDHLTGQAAATTLLQALLPDGAAISIITFSEMDEGIRVNIRPFQEAGLLAVPKVISRW